MHKQNHTRFCQSLFFWKWSSFSHNEHTTMILNTLLLKEHCMFLLAPRQTTLVIWRKGGKKRFYFSESFDSFCHSLDMYFIFYFAKILPIRNHNLVMFVILWHVDFLNHSQKAECKISWSLSLHDVFVSSSFACNRVIKIEAKATFTLPYLNIR